MKKFLFLNLLVVGYWLLIAPAYADFSGNHNIDTQNAGYHWTWNDVIGWIDFHANQTVEVRATELRGWAQSASIGPIVFNCLTSPNGDICSQSDFKVSNNQGVLSGWAWNDAVGWISLSGTNYGVTIDPSGDGINSFFNGWAWSEVVGWISFSCGNQGLCGTFPTYRIQTGAGSQTSSGYLESNIFDTGGADPAYNYMMWRGIPKTGSLVQLQLASSDSSSGPWSFDSPLSLPPDIKAPVADNHQGNRYFKYKVSFSVEGWGGESSVVEDVIINYAP